MNELKEGQKRFLRPRDGRVIGQLAEDRRQVVRRAVDALTQAGAAPSVAELRQRALDASGRFSSGSTDVARRHDDHLSEAYRS